MTIELSEARAEALRARADAEGVTVSELIAQIVDGDDGGVDLELTPEQESNLMESLDQADRGEVVPMAQVMAGLRALRR